MKFPGNIHHFQNKSIEINQFKNQSIQSIGQSNMQMKWFTKLMGTPSTLTQQSAWIDNFTNYP